MSRFETIRFLPASGDETSHPINNKRCVDTSVNGADIKTWYMNLVSSTASSSSVAVGDQELSNKIVSQERRSNQIASGIQLTNQPVPPRRRAPVVRKTSRGADRPNIKTDINSLCKFASEDNLVGIRKCVDAGVSVNSVDGHQWSPLMCAVYAGNVAAVKLLLDLGADRNHRNLKGQSLMDLGRSNNRLDICQLLEGDVNSSANSTAEKSSAISNVGRAGDKKYYCEACGLHYARKEHKASTVHLFSAVKQSPSVASYGIPFSNRGYQLLVKEGWTEDSGLGKCEHGRKYPIKTLLKRDRCGLGGKSSDKLRVTHFDAFDERAVQRAGKAKHSTRSITKRDIVRRENKRVAVEKSFRREFYDIN